MKKIIQILFWILLLSSPLFAASYYGGGGVSTDSNCDQAKYYSIGRLCQDTDDGKLYKGTGAAVAELAAGSSGDFLADGTVPMTGILDAALGLYTKNGETSPGFIDFFEDGSNGSNYARLYGPVSLAGNISWTLPNTALARGSFLIGSSTANTFGWLTVGETGKVITTDGTDPAWSAYTVAAPGAAGAVLYSDGTNWTRSATPSLQALTLTGANTLALGTSRTNDGKVIFSSGTALNDYLFTIQASNFGANLTWTLPTAAPGGANYLLNVDADGTMGYTDPSTVNAATATALAANPTDCDSLGVATAIDASGNLTCGYSIGTNIQAYDAELAALAGLTSAANGIPYFTGAGTAGVISSSADMVSLLGSADYATALSNLGGQASDSALTTLSSKVFSKTALTGTGGLDTIAAASLSDGAIGMVGTTAGIVYWYIYEDSSSASESSPSVIAPDDVGANTGRWLLKLYCDGSSCTVPQTTTGSYQTLLEGSAGGTNFRRTSVPDALTADLTLTHPDAVPTAMSVLAYPAPTDDVSTGSWLTMTDRLVATFDGGGSEIADDKKVYIYVPWDCTITGWTILADKSGAIKVDIWNDTYANYPPTNDDTITAGHEPEISASATKAQDLDVADWGGEALTGGTILAFNVDSCTTITWAQVTLHVVRR